MQSGFILGARLARGRNARGKTAGDGAGVRPPNDALPLHHLMRNALARRPTRAGVGCAACSRHIMNLVEPIRVPEAKRAAPRSAFNLQAVTKPLLRYLIGQELRYPLLFMLRCRATLGRFKKGIDPRFAAELVELAALPIWVYLCLSKRIGKPKAFEIMRVALLSGGVASWSFAYSAVDEPRTFENLCDRELAVNKTGPTRWNTLEVVERTERRFEVKVTRCLYHELTTSVGAPELTPIVCQIDNAGFNSYLPDEVLFHRGGVGRRIADGASECNFIWERAPRPR